MTTVQLIYMNRKKSNARVKGQLYKALVRRCPLPLSPIQRTATSLSLNQSSHILNNNVKVQWGNTTASDYITKRLNFTAFMDALFIRKES